MSSTETKTYGTIDDLRAALSDLPEDVVIRDRSGNPLYAADTRFLRGYSAPYTVTYEVPDTPALLDPSKVKVGDFVEVVVTPVGHAPEYIVRGGVWASSAGALFVGQEELSSPRLSLMDHQPAPEPEPSDELADTVHHVLALPNYEASHATAHVVEKIRERFVVIDPADVDVDALVERYCEEYRAAEEYPLATRRKAGMRAALATLGIEAS